MGVAALTEHGSVAKPTPHTHVVEARVRVRAVMGGVAERVGGSREERPQI